MGTRSIFIILKVNRDQSIANMALEFWKPIWDDNYSWKHLKIASNRDQFPPAIGLVLLFELPQMTIGLPESKHVLSSEKPELDSLSTECITLAFLKFSGPVCVRSFNHSEGPEGGPSLVCLDIIWKKVVIIVSDYYQPCITFHFHLFYLNLTCARSGGCNYLNLYNILWDAHVTQKKSLFYLPRDSIRVLAGKKWLIFSE